MFIDCGMCNTNGVDIPEEDLKVQVDDYGHPICLDCWNNLYEKKEQSND